MLKLLEAGRADIAISYEPELLIARDKGAQIVSVGAIAQAPLTSLMTLDRRRVRDVTDLRGGRVGTAGIPYQSAYLRTILETARVPVDSVKETSVGFNLVPAMLSRRVDATLGAFWNVEGVQLERARRNPRIWRMDELGVPTYDELVLASTKEFVGDRGDDVRAFVQALARGYEAARADPQAATDALVQAVPDLDAGFALASVRATLPVFFPRTRASRGASRCRPSGTDTATGCTRTGCSTADRRRAPPRSRTSSSPARAAEARPTRARRRPRPARAQRPLRSGAMIRSAFSPRPRRSRSSERSGSSFVSSFTRSSRCATVWRWAPIAAAVALTLQSCAR